MLASSAVFLSVALSFCLGAGVATVILTRPRDRWPLLPCDSSGKTAMDYLFEILSITQRAAPNETEQIKDLVRRCMQHAPERYSPPPAYPVDGHCECLHKALEGAAVGNWQLVVDELSHDG